jgi:hypothetical protein
MIAITGSIYDVQNIMEKYPKLRELELLDVQQFRNSILADINSVVHNQKTALDIESMLLVNFGQDMWIKQFLMKIKWLYNRHKK